LTVKVRYKPPQGDVSTKLSVVVPDTLTELDKTNDDMRFGVAVANVALLLRGSPHVKQSNLESARALAAGAIGRDQHGDRREFVALVDAARRMSGSNQTVLNKVAR
jgi:Ca-activated chloride channel family protein